MRLRWPWLALVLLLGRPSPGPAATGTGAPSTAAGAEAGIVTLDSYLTTPAFSTQRLCRQAPPAPAAGVPRKRILGEIYEEEIWPLPSGPHIAERPPAGLPRTLTELRAAFATRRSELSACYRVGRFVRPVAQELVRVQGEVSPFGELTVTDVVAQTSGDAALVACLQKALSGLRTAWMTPRHTQFAVVLRFRPSALPPPLKPLTVPAAGHPQAWNGPACTLTLDPLPVDRLAPAETLLELDEVSPELQQIEWHRQHDWPEVRLRAALRQNLGAYQACYAKALVNHPGLIGRLVLKTQVYANGDVTAAVKESDLPDEALGDCLRRAVSAVWMYPTWPLYQPDEVLEFDYPLVLRLPSATAPVLPAGSGGPQAEEASGSPSVGPDGAEELRRLGRLLRRAPRDPHVCLWRVEEFAALMRARPWLWLDSAAEVAVAPLLGALGAEPPTSDCWKQADRLLGDFAFWPHKLGRKLELPALIERAMARYPLLVRLGRSWPKAYQTRYWQAEALFTLGRYCEAAPVYTEVVAWPEESHRIDAAYAAVVAWKNCLDIADTGQGAATEVKDLLRKKQQERQAAQASGKPEAKHGEWFAPQRIPQPQQLLLEAFSTYLNYVPAAPELATIKYRRALIYYEYNHLDKAIPLFQDLVESYAQSELAIYSAELLLDCLVIKVRFGKEGNDDDSLQLMQEQVHQLAALARRSEDKVFADQLDKFMQDLLRRRCFCGALANRRPDYRADGERYLQQAERNPNDPKLDELLFNAALNFGQAHLIDRSISAYEKLISAKPDSRLARPALYHLGQAYQSVAAYREAADRYETFATKYPGERVDAPTALLQAVFFRRGLGQTDQAIADVNLFIKNYGNQKEFFAQAAGMFFNLGQLYEQRKDYQKLKQNYSAYLRSWAPKGGIDRQIIAEVKLGELAWRSSCPVVGIHGACIDIKREQASSVNLIAAKPVARYAAQKGQSPRTLGQSGPATKSQITVYGRKPELVQEAMAHFTTAIRLYKGGAAANEVPQVEAALREGRIAAMTYHIALARMAQGDQLYEELLNLKIPTGLVFDPWRKQVDDAAVYKFQSWLTIKNHKLGQASKLYQDVFLLKNAHWVLAATARLGQLYQDFANGLYTAPIPTPPAPPPGLGRDEWQQRFRTAYCDQMTDAAESLEAKAVQSLSTCLSQATELGWFNEWSRLCELELNQLQPGKFPLASEIRAEPGYAGVTLDVAPPGYIVTAEEQNSR